MKTAERILLTALELFNEHGENAVTSVDIALELDISPGNLYYHYKGKEVIIDALMALHKKQLLGSLNRSLVEDLHAEDLFYYFYILVEKLSLFRFLYRSPADIVEKYPSIQSPQQQLLKALENQLDAIFKKLQSRAEIMLTGYERPLMVESLMLLMTQVGQRRASLKQQSTETKLYHVLSLIMVNLLPRLKLKEAAIKQILDAIQSHSVSNINSNLPDLR
ncbi:TetR/AcrR family transcriptional regulator [Alteromonas sp. ASW11-130]|uniref:TetR/AcrR family transcriptional regulator n=1 Tax=Alteromonas sp. ASW11-130 TaxID=3015775 RepID=UPI002241B956|nr:TetR/AcrR family transcriptional regulator [Alteromonas sp. ASW11-130]MCW8092562.1 TetR/AcrR family transcriptional regulator [Alteromonas sp. ASW11-130]